MRTTSDTDSSSVRRPHRLPRVRGRGRRAVAAALAAAVGLAVTAAASERGEPGAMPGALDDLVVGSTGHGQTSDLVDSGERLAEVIRSADRDTIVGFVESYVRVGSP